MNKTNLLCRTGNTCEKELSRSKQGEWTCPSAPIEQGPEGRGTVRPDCLCFRTAAITAWQRQAGPGRLMQQSQAAGSSSPPRPIPAEASLPGSSRTPSHLGGSCRAAPGTSGVSAWVGGRGARTRDLGDPTSPFSGTTEPQAHFAPSLTAGSAPGCVASPGLGSLSSKTRVGTVSPSRRV